MMTIAWRMRRESEAYWGVRACYLPSLYDVIIPVKMPVKEQVWRQVGFMVNAVVYEGIAECADGVDGGPHE